ncbi:ABC transporter substrate-binding protein [Brevibacterium sp. 50QC2O2]|uniref:ABC transporter substrate-binding protein n=1 Tax=Brevibacterium TaxID=1696 RepID=UPI00211BCB65|nr:MULTISPECIES: ABC transporter substrate-binding protein [unclassified Brevibacterium]MCQ9384217.1 ABC transporter substrate-binding protein [Brevibacterium sp. 68QC2CO]MCQ9388304.1 ABC transporter substrate-binding protein [Brevibacterium sp. 50QC2O2]
MKKTPRALLRTTLSLTTMAALGLGLAACGGSGSGSGSDTVVLGYTGPLSGGGASYGENVKIGLEMSVDKINEAGVKIDGKDVKIELKSLDDKYVPSTAATNSQRLADQDKAAVVFSPNAGAIKAMQQVNNGRSKFLIGGYTSDPEIVQHDNPLTIMIPPNFKSYAEPFTKKLMDEGAKKISLLGTQSEYGQQWTAEVKTAWSTAGGTVGKDNSVDYATVSDFAGPVSKALAEKPDTIFVGGPSQPTALIMEEARKQGFKGSFFVMDQAKLNEMATITDEKNLYDSVGVRPVEEYDEPGTKDFLAAFKTKTEGKKVATSESALHYSAVPVFVKAMELAGTTSDPDKIREKMSEAVTQVDKSFYVQTPATKVTDAGHLMADTLDASFLDKSGKYQTVEVPQADDSK